MAELVPVTDASFEAEVINSDRPVMIEYWAEYCSQCKQLLPILAELAAEYQGLIKFAKLNAEEQPLTPASQFVQGLPTLQIWNQGALIKTILGAKPKSTLRKALAEFS